MKNILVLIVLLFLSSSLFSQGGVYTFYFERGKTTFIPTSEKAFKEFIHSNKNKDLVINIETSCDSIGSEIYNEYLSKNRLSTLEYRCKLAGLKVKDGISRGELKMSGPMSYQRKAVISIELNGSIEKKVVSDSVKTQIASKYKDVLNSKSNVEPIVLDIQFIPGQDVFLNDQAFQEASGLFEFLNQNPNVKAFIRGHVCCKDDLTMSTMRAYKVYQYLTERKIDPKRLEFKGFSNTMPVVYPEINEFDRQKNRRVDVIFSINN